MTQFPPVSILIQEDGQGETCPVVQLGEVIPFLLDADCLHLGTQEVWKRRKRREEEERGEEGGGRREEGGGRREEGGGKRRGGEEERRRIREG